MWQATPEDQARVLQPQRRGEPDFADAPASEPERLVDGPLRVADDNACEIELVAQLPCFVGMSRHDGDERHRIELLQCALHLDQVLVARQSAQMTGDDDDGQTLAGVEKTGGLAVGVDQLEIKDGRHRDV